MAFDYAAASSGVTIEYTPFVFKVNPNRGRDFNKSCN
ncbi:hypothetical protein NXW94_15920 [Bacteroides ovatus]|nr:hypothetical protein [Bacteroides ovatus]